MRQPQFDPPLRVRFLDAKAGAVVLGRVWSETEEPDPRRIEPAGLRARLEATRAHRGHDGRFNALESDQGDKRVHVLGRTARFRVAIAGAESQLAARIDAARGGVHAVPLPGRQPPIVDARQDGKHVDEQT